MPDFDAELKQIYEKHLERQLKIKAKLEKEVAAWLETHSDVEEHLLNASVNKHGAAFIKALEDSQ